MQDCVGMIVKAPGLVKVQHLIRYFGAPRHLEMKCCIHQVQVHLGLLFSIVWVTTLQSVFHGTQEDPTKMSDDFREYLTL